MPLNSGIKAASGPSIALFTLPDATARAETGNATFGDMPTDMWDGEFAYYNELLPHWLDMPEATFPEGMYWRGDPFSNWQAGWWWNVCHVSDHSGINVVALDKEVNSYHMNDPFTWEDAICAITRLYDSLDPEKLDSGITPPIVNSSKPQNVYYNLNGQRVNRPTKGIYIANGKKFIVK